MIRKPYCLVGEVGPVKTIKAWEMQLHRAQWSLKTECWVNTRWPWRRLLPYSVIHTDVPVRTNT